MTKLRLDRRSAEPRIVYALGRYEIRVTPHDLLAAMTGNGPIPFSDEVFAASVLSRLPLQGDLSIHDILTALAPEAPAPGEKSMRTADYSRFWRQSDERLRYEMAELLESGRAVVVEKSSGVSVAAVTRNKYSDGCYSGRKFLGPGGAVLFEVVDGMV